MGVVAIKELLEAGVHFGHQTNRWNPKMKRFLFGERNGVYIIDLQQTVARMEQAYAFARDTVAAGESVLFVGTKRQAAEILEEEAKRANQFFINQRWLGGMLTNFQTIRRSIDKMKKMETTLADPTHQGHTKKELGQMQKGSRQAPEEPVGHPQHACVARCGIRLGYADRAHRDPRGQPARNPSHCDPRLEL